MLVVDRGRVVQSGPPNKVLAQPANLEVARLLGVFNLLTGEIKVLDPGRNLSRVAVGGAEIEGPYFPGRLKGDRVTVCVRPEQMTAMARAGRLGPNQMAVDLARTVERPQWVRLEFVTTAGEPLAVDLTRADYERNRANPAWMVEFPRELLRVVSRDGTGRVSAA